MKGLYYQAMYSLCLSAKKQQQNQRMYFNMRDDFARRADVIPGNLRFPPQAREHLSQVIRTVLIMLTGKTELRHGSCLGLAVHAADPSFPSCSPQSRETRLKAEA